jgi:hypothetical protein
MKRKLFIIGLACSLLLAATVVNAQTRSAIPIYEYYNNTYAKHFYTTNYAELGSGSGGWAYVGILGYLYNQFVSAPPGGSTTVYRFYQGSSHAHYYTLNASVYPSGFVYEGVMGYETSTPLYDPSNAPVYEFFNSSTGDYFYSKSSITPTGFHLNGVAYYAF